MADPFLLAHWCAPLQFTIAGPLTPVSIRDQMIRGRMFVDRAIEQTLLAPNQPLVVVGAGAAGVTAAMRAAQLQIPVTLVEASHQAFGRQKKSTSRWIDPTQYDWPADHWPQASFPWGPPPMQLPWAAQRSSVIAAAWDREFRRAQARYPHLEVLYNSSVTAINWLPSQQLDIDIQTPAGPVTRTCSALLDAVGFGTEKSSLGTYQGFEFWDSETLEKPNMGLGGRPQPYRVLIAGGGDGALQDLLRVTTGLKSAEMILQKLPRQVQDMVSTAIYSAEDQAQRAGIWCERQHEHAVFARLHWSHQLQVRRMFTDPSISGPLQSALHHVLAHAKGMEIVLAHPCDHFSRCYGLNRFLCLLILEYASMARLAISAMPGTGMLAVNPVGHSCTGARPCHGLEHRVLFQAYSCARNPSGTVQGSPRTFDAVILRMGVTPPKPFTGRFQLLVTRQILPYYAAQ